ncbi:MAG: carotenoid biosynthesis protein [Trueperaceae bacterium]|nr:carotenoid biosynthesis protein [Trueperaceae bacterium]
MTYLQFHLVFTLPWLALLFWRARRTAARGGRVAGPGTTNRFAWGALLAHLAIAFVYTTPWDNYLVFREVWGYPPGRVWFTIGWVPVEEYAFFLIQTAGTGLFLFWLMRARAWRRYDGPLPEATIRWAGAAILLLIAALGGAALARESTTYLGLIVAWAFPVLALQWGFGGDFLVRRAALVVTAFGVPTAWLWIADKLAIQFEIWWISERFTIGVAPFGLPVEEATFFLVTNLLVTWGITMALDPAAQARLQAVWRDRAQAWRLALLGWAIAMVPTPLVPEAFPGLAYTSTGLLAGGLLGFAVHRYGVRALAAFAVAFAFGVLIEAIGERTGVPFGSYTYTAPGPAILGVPLLVPLGWWAFTLGAMAIAPRRGRLFWAPLALVAWDVGLDPLMVHMGFWRFEQGAYFGIPLSNFVGWYVAGLVLVALLGALLPDLRTERPPILRAVYWGQAGFMGLGLVLFGLPWAGLAAFVAMSAVAAAGEAASRETPRARRPSPT